jgi:hypothetical protein
MVLPVVRLTRLEIERGFKALVRSSLTHSAYWIDLEETGSELENTDSSTKSLEIRFCDKERLVCSIFR